MHAKTDHSYLSIRKNPNFLDWATQPQSFKRYPHFYRRYKTELIPDLGFIGGITLKKTHGDTHHYLRTVPSAGALYTSEVYIQLRGQAGLVDGIYHYEPLHDNLVLIHELGEDGVEAYFREETKYGMVFLIASAYFRSSWKYGSRAIRYVMLDAGHQIGAIAAFLNHRQTPWTLHFDMDLDRLNFDFGFEGSEFFLAAVTVEPKVTRHPAKPLRQRLPFVCPSDYTERNTHIENEYARCLLEARHSSTFETLGRFEKEVIVQRRSARQFTQRQDEKILFDRMDALRMLANTHGIDLYMVVKNITDVTPGLYRNGTLMSEGDFSRRCAYLALEQSIVAPANITLFFAAGETDYFQNYILTGLLGHFVYLEAEKLGLGCSGIGAYYDEETKEFLQTDKNILYVMIVG